MQVGDVLVSIDGLPVLGLNETQIQAALAVSPASAPGVSISTIIAQRSRFLIPAPFLIELKGRCACSAAARDYAARPLWFASPQNLAC